MKTKKYKINIPDVVPKKLCLLAGHIELSGLCNSEIEDGYLYVGKTYKFHFSDIPKEWLEEIKEDFCYWELHDSDNEIYQSECGELHIFTEGTPRENKYNFCPYCGRIIQE